MSERDQFEAWACKIYDTRLLKGNDGNYLGQVLQQMWEAWQASREALKAEQEGSWIACRERMPDDNPEIEVLACFTGGDISTLYYSDGGWDDAYGICPIRQDVTHWQPLPAPPSQPHTIDTTSQQYETLAKGE